VPRKRASPRRGHGAGAQRAGPHRLLSQAQLLGGAASTAVAGARGATGERWRSRRLRRIEAFAAAEAASATSLNGRERCTGRLLLEISYDAHGFIKEELIIAKDGALITRILA